LTENVAFLIDFDSNLMVFNMDAWAYAVVDNSQKPGTGNRERGTGGKEQGTGNMGTPVAVKQGGKRSYECGVQSAECRVKN
jgi:hypothetical protein